MTPGIHEILEETTTMYRKGPAVEERDQGPVHVVEVWGFPHVEDAPPEQALIDTHFVTVGVDPAKAQARKADLIAWLRAYPQPERLAAGPSYIETGAVLGSQDAALRLYAPEYALGLWKLITPERLLGPAEDDATRDQYRTMAGNGFVMITGWKDKVEA